MQFLNLHRAIHQTTNKRNYGNKKYNQQSKKGLSGIFTAIGNLFGEKLSEQFGIDKANLVIIL